MVSRCGLKSLDVPGPWRSCLEKPCCLTWFRRWREHQHSYIRVRSVILPTGTVRFFPMPSHCVVQTMSLRNLDSGVISEQRNFSISSVVFQDLSRQRPWWLPHFVPSSFTVAEEQSRLESRFRQGLLDLIKRRW